MKKIFTALLMIFVMVTFFGCDYMENADTSQAYKQAASLKEANAQIGMPAIKNFQERKLMKLILELRDNTDLVCFAYIVPEMTGQLKFIGKCIGYGIPYSTQYTSPKKPYGTGHEGEPQADPNGLFMPESSEGTWLMMIDPRTNEPRPVYVEPRVLVSPFPLPTAIN